MISYIKGTLVHRGNGVVVVEASGLGYEIFVSAATLSVLPEVGETVKIHTHMNVKEDGISLYGFSTAEELELFQLKPQEIILAILSDDVKTLSKAPGVGRKTAQRVILELKDKFQTADAIAMEIEAEELMPTGSNGAKFEAMDALAALGYSRSEAAKAVNGVAAEGMTTEDILKAALKKMVTF